MKCPKDANTIGNTNPCSVVCSNGIPFVCSRDKGHKGLHHAHDIKAKCHKVWK